MKKTLLTAFMFSFIACGQESTTVEDGSKTDSKSQESKNDSATVSTDLGAAYDALCTEKDPYTWDCAKRCVKLPDRSWCGVYDEYCKTHTSRPKDIEFCSWWAASKK